MKSFSTVLLPLLFSTSFAIAQKWGTNTFSQFTNEANDVEFNSTGESYVTGYITGETAFNSSNVVPSAAGNGDIYVAKYAANGTLIWKQTFGGNYSDRAYDLAVGPDDNIVVTGQFFGTVTFGSTTLTSVSTSKDIFLVKLDPLGNVIWARSEGGNLSDNAYGVTIDQQNNVILTGQFQGTATIGNNSFTSSLDPNTNQPSFDFFLSKYDINGNPIWSLNGTAPYEDRGLAVATDDQNNIYFTGQFSKTLSFANNSFPNQGYNIGFLSKISPSGQLLFFNQLKAGMVIPYDLEINGNNQIMVSGDFLGNMNYYDGTGQHSVQNPFEKQIFVLKTTSGGNYLWHQTLGSSNEISARAISIDLHNDAFITGYFKCDLSQIQDTAQATFTSVGFKDPYLWKVSDNGTTEYVKHFGGKKDDEGLGIAIRLNDQPLICGSFTKDLNFAYDYSNLPANTANNNYSLHFFTGETPHYYLSDDETRNSFLINLLNEDYPTLNYYSVSTTDSIEGHIIPFLNTSNWINDTLHFCTSDSLQYNPLTYNHFGPAYSFLWNTGETINKKIVTTTGDVFVDVTRLDECQTTTDSIFVISEPIPTVPLLTDNLSINVAHPGPFYNNYSFCYPDSVIISYTPTDTSATFTTATPNGTILSGSGPFTVQQEGWFITTVQNTYCFNHSEFHFNFDFVYPNDSVSPEIVMLTPNPSGDSISICYGSSVYFNGIDLITNPAGNFNPNITSPVTNVQWYINGGSRPNYPQVKTFFNPVSTGWYTVDLYFSTGYNNLCGVDTTNYHITRQFYIEVKPLPTWNGTISGSNLLCPNGSVFLTVNNPHPSLHWSGPGIIWNNLNDSIEINAAGTYHYHGVITDSISGCSATVGTQKIITLKTAPNILSNPADAIVCPNDSVLLFLPTNYLSYQWVGPLGDTLSDSSSCIGADLGFYYCHVVDIENCPLTTPPYELKEYATPSLSIFPDEYLCVGETATIQVEFSGTPTILWSPINSSSPSITVNTAGVYSLQIEQCGITITDSVIIYDGTFTSTIMASDTLLCYGDTIFVEGNNVGFNYEWNTGDVTNGFLPVFSAGSYSALVTNDLGCTATTNTIIFSEVAGSAPPVFEEVMICPGNDVTFSTPTSLSINWYQAMDTTLLQSSTTFTLSNVVSDTFILAAYSNSECPISYGLVSVTIYDSLPDFQIVGDVSLCFQENGEFSIPVNNESVAWYSGNTLLGTSNQITIPYNQLLSNQVISAVVSNDCFSSTLHTTVQLLPITQLYPSEDTLYLCNGVESQIVLQNLSELTSIYWISNSDTIVGDELTLIGGQNQGNFTVVAEDTNGCITNTATILVINSQLSSSISINFSNFCAGDSGNISLQTNADSLHWNTPFGTLDSTFINFTVNDTTNGWYILEQWDTIGCHYIDSVNIPQYTLPSISILPDTIFCLNDIYTFYFPQDTNTYQWLTLGNETDIPIAFDQLLVLEVTTPLGCVNYDTLVVQTVNCENDLPNIITPNGDGKNDYFFIDDATSQLKNELIIMNRYGNTVFRAAPYVNDFDGNSLNEGVYFYHYFPNGSTDASNLRQGILHIVR